jgi:hypothetical protein
MKSRLITPKGNRSAGRGNCSQRKKPEIFQTGFYCGKLINSECAKINNNTNPNHRKGWLPASSRLLSGNNKISMKHRLMPMLCNKMTAFGTIRFGYLKQGSFFLILVIGSIFFGGCDTAKQQNVSRKPWDRPIPEQAPDHTQNGNTNY